MNDRRSMFNDPILLPRLLLVTASLLMAFGGTMHASAFSKLREVVLATGLPSFYAGSFQLLWLADSATMFAVAVISGYLAVRPMAASRIIILLLALIPVGNAVLIYTFLGGFFAGHLHTATAILLISAAVCLPRSGSSGQSEVNSQS